jgi:hypothetical protein
MATGTEIGTLRVSGGVVSMWDGTGWRKTAMFEPVSPSHSGGIDVKDPETTGMPPGSILTPPVPDDGDDGDDMVPWQVLLEVLLCPECGMELGTEACSPRHAFLADNPEEHADVRPLVARYLAQARAGDRRCHTCEDSGLATGTCTHLDIRADQVRMSREEWEKLVVERDAFAWREAVPTLGGARCVVSGEMQQIAEAVCTLVLDGHGHHFAVIDDGRTLLCSRSARECLEKAGLGSS